MRLRCGRPPGRSRAPRRRSDRSSPSGSDPRSTVAARLTRRIRSVGIDLEDGIGRAVDDRGQLESFELQRRSELGVPEGHRQLVSGELEDPDPGSVEIRIGRWDDPDQAGRPTLDERQGDSSWKGRGPGVAVLESLEPTRQRPRRRSCRPDEVEPVAAGRRQPQPHASGTAQSDELHADRLGQLAGVATEARI